MTTLKRIMLAVACVLAVFTNESAASTVAPTLTAYFHKGVATPFDLLYYERDSDRTGEGRFYVTTLTMNDDREGIIRLEDPRSSALALEYAVDAERGIRGPVGTHPDTALDDFFMDNYSQWCGKVHNGVRIKWQFCTGKDCPGGGICIKHCVKVAGTCIP